MMRDDACEAHMDGTNDHFVADATTDAVRNMARGMCDGIESTWHERNDCS